MFMLSNNLYPEVWSSKIGRSTDSWLFLLQVLPVCYFSMQWLCIFRHHLQLRGQYCFFTGIPFKQTNQFTIFNL